MPQNKISTGDKIFLVVAIALAVIGIVDFIFYDHDPRDLLMGIGFTLMAYGTYRNGNPRWSATKNYVPLDKAAHYGSTIGLLLVLGAFAARYLL